MFISEASVRLQKLLDELAHCRGKKQDGRVQNYERTLPEARKLSMVPLVHGSDKKDILADVVDTGALLSRTMRGLSPNKAEQYLGISDCVYTSAGILYPDARVAFVFRPSVESPGTTASPWDSGAFVGPLCPDLPRAPDPQRRDSFVHYSLPAPEYREYLVCYVASCYWEPQHYLDPGKRHAFPDPIGALSGHPRSRNFEVRIPGQLAVTNATLRSVFLLESDAVPAPAVTDWLRQLERDGVTIEMCSGSSKYLESHVREWIANDIGYENS